MKHRRHIIWDWNGTLLDDLSLCIDIANAMLQDHGLATLNVSQYQKAFGFPIRDYYTRIGFSPTDFEQLAARFIQEYDARVDECSLHDGVAELLHALQRAGKRQTILTAARTRTVEVLLREHGIRDYFDEVIGLDDHYAHSKVEAGQRWMREQSVGTGDVVLIGDTVHDHEVAEALGVECRLVSHGHHSHEQLAECGRSVTAHIFDEIDSL